MMSQCPQAISHQWSAPLQAPSRPRGSARGGSSDAVRRYTALWRNARRGPGALPSPWRITAWRWRGPQDCIAVTRVIGDCADFRILRLGYEIQYRTDKSVQGALFSSICGMGPESRMWRNYIAICARKTPMETDTPYVGPHADFLSMRETLFPFGTSDGRVTHVLAVVEFFPHGGPGLPADGLTS